MPTATENRQPAPLSPLKRMVGRHPVVAFLVMLYAIAWSVFLPVVLQARGLLALPIDLTEGFAFDAVTSLASILGVALPAFLVTATTSGKAGVRDLLSRCLRWRGGLVWYLAALFGLLAVMVLLGSVLSDPAPLEVLTERWSLLFTLFLPEVLLPFLTIQLFEEAGWTGFMQHTLPSQDVEDGVKDRPRAVCTGSSSLAGGRKMVTEALPLGVGQVGWISFAPHGEERRPSLPWAPYFPDSFSRQFVNSSRPPPWPRAKLLQQ